ncbi:MAG: hypothetical protein GXO29_00215 [Thermotogae bacterium]|nr:hypothetical protein [Thermotogota bacterium]
MRLKELIEGEVRRRAERILMEAHERASLILHKARLEADDIIREHRPLAQSTYEQSFHSFLSRYYTEAKAKVLSAQMEVLKEARRRAMESLSEIVADRPRYRDLLKRLVEATLGYIGKSAAVHVNPRDVELVREILEELPQEWVLKPPKDASMWNIDVSAWEVVPDESVWAGVVVRDRERNFILNNDLSVRLERAYQSLLEDFRKEVEYFEEGI